MEYLLMIHTDPETLRPSDPSTSDGAAEMGAWLAYNQALVDGGHWIAGASLMPPDLATVTRVDPTAGATVTDGPFAETKEQIGGYYLVEAADLDEALRLAQSMPLPSYAVEVRPIAFRPGAAG